MRRRVVITGLGAVTPLGNSVDETWAAICAGRSGIGPITRFDASALKTQIAGELKRFDPLAHIPKRELKKLDHFIVYATVASEMAMADSGLAALPFDKDRFGVVIGSGIGGISTIESGKETLLKDGPNFISAFSLPASLANLAAGEVSIRFGARGYINCPAAACSSGNIAIGDAARAIANGHADAMIAGGGEAPITALSIAGFNAVRALSTHNAEPGKASRPFDAKRDGFVMGEGSGIVILEELSFARRRGARIYAELAGYACNSDAFHRTAPPPGHEGAARCMRLALADAGLSPAEIDYVNAHGTSTPLNDAAETEAIKAVFAGTGRIPAVSSTKSMTGHLLGAAGGIEAVFAVKSITDHILPPTINLEAPDPACDLDYVANKARPQKIDAVMSNAFGFGGVNSVLVFKRWAEP